MTKNYVAQMNGDMVEAIIVAEYEWVQANLEGDWHDLGAEPLTVAIGFTYDAVNDVFSPPPTVEVI